jgi:hypothetical protein
VNPWRECFIFTGRQRGKPGQTSKGPPLVVNSTTGAPSEETSDSQQVLEFPISQALKSVYRVVLSAAISRTGAVAVVVEPHPGLYTYIYIIIY